MTTPADLWKAQMQQLQATGRCPFVQYIQPCHLTAPGRALCAECLEDMKSEKKVPNK